MNCAIELRNLSVYIGSKKILDSIDLCIPRASITAILGPSGSGKTTLLRTINRLIELVPGARVEGEVLVMGINAYRVSPYRVRRMISMVFQVPNPFPHMSIFDNVAIAAKLNGVKSKEDIRRVVEDALRDAMLWDEVKNRLRDKPTVLSGGQQQRLCLARALAAKPSILLLDEPTANIDMHNTIMIEQALQRIVRERGVTIVLVTHIPQQAIRLANYVAVMYSGKIVEFGPTTEIAKNPRHDITKKLLGVDDSTLNKVLIAT